MSSTAADNGHTRNEIIIVLCLQSFSFLVYTASLTYVTLKIKGHMMTRFMIMLLLFAVVFSVRLILDVLRVIFNNDESKIEQNKNILHILLMVHDIFSKL